MILNLDRMTRSNWSSQIVSLVREYQYRRESQQSSLEHRHQNNISRNISNDDNLDVHPQFGSKNSSNETDHHDNYANKSDENRSRSRSRNHHDNASDKKWEAKQNDQDILNVVMELRPSWFRVLPCEWNVQFHARINSISKCLPTFLPSIVTDAMATYTAATSSDAFVSQRQFLLQANLRFSDVPLNCLRNYTTSADSDGTTMSSSRTQSLNDIFVCEAKPKVLHFMANTYNGYYHFLEYFAYSWEFYSSLAWNLLY